MSTVYYVELETKLSLRDCADLFLKNLEYELLRETDSLLSYRTKFFDFTVNTLNKDADFIIGLDLKTSIRISIFNHREGSFPVLIKLFIQWVHASQENAALVYDWQYIHLLWKNGKLIRNSNPDLWTDEGVSMIDIPYKDEKLAVL
jgi:hypothetical protein